MMFLNDLYIGAELCYSACQSVSLAAPKPAKITPVLPASVQRTHGFLTRSLAQLI